MKRCWPAHVAVVLAALSFAEPAQAADGFFPGDEAVMAVRAGDDLYRYCRRQARKVYGPVKGRHSGSIRLAVISQCAWSGGRLP